jgi:ATP diphosphatase
MSKQQRKSHDQSGFAVEGDTLEQAVHIQERAASQNFDWPDARGALAKLEEEAVELKALLSAPPSDDAELRASLSEEIGDLLFAAVNVARLCGASPSASLADASAKFERRFERLLGLARLRGLDPRESSLEELDALWEEVKREEKLASDSRAAEDQHRPSRAAED